ncbi:MAG: hypothetical protein KDB14_31090 [Planctomycetales bacterium]|nr:hypothetical protein [Planctomycetales bacterium]
MKLFAVICALCVALCWGMYGPTLANARSPNREWGPFKPYIFIGVAYVVIAIIGGAIMMKVAFNDNFDYTGKYQPAMKWGFLSGCLGALGALALTFSLTKAGGKPSYVMPIVFGGAVTVNAIAAYLTLHKGETVNPLMWLGMAMVALGICLTAGYTPHGHPPAKPGAAPHADASSQADGASQGDPPSLEKH